MPEPVRHNESQGVIVEQAEKAGTDFDRPASAGGPPVASRVQNNLPCAAPLCIDEQVPFGPGIGAHPESDLRPAKRLVQRLHGAGVVQANAAHGNDALVAPHTQALGIEREDPGRQ